MHDVIVIGIAGGTGSGKSTLINMIAGLVMPTEGSVSVCGEQLQLLDDVGLSKLRNERIGIVPQGQTALFNLTVADNVKLPYLMYRPDDGIQNHLLYHPPPTLAIAVCRLMPRHLLACKTRRFRDIMCRLRMTRCHALFPKVNVCSVSRLLPLRFLTTSTI